MSRRWRNPAARIRQRRSDPPWVAPEAPAPETAPEFRGQRVRARGVRSRPGRITAPLTQPVVPSGPGRRTALIVPSRRGRFLAPPPLPPPGPAPLVPALHRRPRHLPIVRGRYARVPLVGLAPVAIAWRPRAGSVSITEPATGTVTLTGIASAGSVTLREIATAGTVTLT